MKMRMKDFKGKRNNDEKVIVESGKYEVKIVNVKISKKEKGKYKGFDGLSIGMRIRDDVNQKYGKIYVWDNLVWHEDFTWKIFDQIGNILGLDEEKTYEPESYKLDILNKEVMVEVIKKKAKRKSDGELFHLNNIKNYMVSDLLEDELDIEDETEESDDINLDTSDVDDMEENEKENEDLDLEEEEEETEDENYDESDEDLMNSISVS
ncbi:DUF669 domain-containing protein [Virgibacillus sp. DJP39]|uniref:DUF669 domain-containing protein n=1 Tax=Virgibacillus sp. DJP39 TaxID=3409790 RepID=UPI003BB6D0BD